MSKTKQTQVQDDDFQYEVIKNFTLPLLKLELDTPYFLRIDDPVTIGKKLKGDDADKEPAKLCKVTDLKTGEENILLVNSVLEGILHDYDEESVTINAYVGKCFKIVKHAKKDGKRYHGYTVAEIKVNK